MVEYLYKSFARVVLLFCCFNAAFLGAENKTVLITGGAGFIGSNFTEYMFNVLDALTYSATCQNFTVEEQDKILKAKRSNNQLDTEKLQQLYPNLPSAKDSLHTVFQKMKNDLDKKQQTK